MSLTMKKTQRAKRVERLRVSTSQEYGSSERARIIQSGSRSRHNEVVPAFLLEGDASLLHEPDNEKDATREARWTASGRDLAGVFGSPQVTQAVQNLFRLFYYNLF